mmetsp:Transcript_4490/g.19106  ORF Transcript_4490/g.19106 Transcript_4490/m.19106 type:complete len:210 (+) Transcript_4490:2851-3480(+)
MAAGITPGFSFLVSHCRSGSCRRAPCRGGHRFHKSLQRQRGRLRRSAQQHRPQPLRRAAKRSRFGVWLTCVGRQLPHTPPGWRPFTVAALLCLDLVQRSGRRRRLPAGQHHRQALASVHQLDGGRSPIAGRCGRALQGQPVQPLCCPQLASRGPQPSLGVQPEDVLRKRGFASNAALSGHAQCDGGHLQRCGPASWPAAPAAVSSGVAP